jgi:hypothetical protein
LEFWGGTWSKTKIPKPFNILNASLWLAALIIKKTKWTSQIVANCPKIRKLFQIQVAEFVWDVYLCIMFSFWKSSPFFIFLYRNLRGPSQCELYAATVPYIRGGLISLWLYKGNKLRDCKNCIYISPPWAPHTYDFVVLTSLTYPRKIILVMLQIGKAKDLSAPLSSRKPMSNFFRCTIPIVNSFVRILAIWFLLCTLFPRRVVEPGVPVVARNEGRVVPVPGP